MIISMVKIENLILDLYAAFTEILNMCIFQVLKINPFKIMLMTFFDQTVMTMQGFEEIDLHLYLWFTTYLLASDKKDILVLVFIIYQCYYNITQYLTDINDHKNGDTFFCHLITNTFINFLLYKIIFFQPRKLKDTLFEV